MTINQWLTFIFIIQIIHGLGTWKLYRKSGFQAWQAFVPIYNGIVFMKILNRPWWWIFLLFIPIVNLIMFPVVWVETARSFGKNSFTDTFLVVITLGFYAYYLNYLADVTYIKDRDLKPKSASGDWAGSILFAIVVATIVHTYFIQPFTIPTSSLEKTLLVGDFLFVSKFHYGARTPMTTIAAPMLHDSIPFIKTKSYLYDDDVTKKKTSWKNKLQLPPFRFPSLQKIKRNDIVVFSWPVDTVRYFRDPSKIHAYKPVDKKSNYVKRCVGIPGDSLEIKEGFVYINGKRNELPDRAKLQFSYIVTSKGGGFNHNYLRDRYNIKDGFSQIDRNTYYFKSATAAEINRLKSHPNVSTVKRFVRTKGERNPSIFPYSPNFNWNTDFFGPIYIPEAGKTIHLTLEALPLYERIITEYESNTLSVNNGQILINDKPTDTYTFKQNYYWMMGDNRHNSEDARTWGFTPFSHVVGKPVFVWLSWNTHGKGFNKIRWERLFTTVGGSGKPTSYFVPFILLLLGWYGFSKWKKRKKKSA